MRDSQLIGTAASFTVLAATQVVSSGLTRVHGDLGVYPGTLVTGFLPGVVAGGKVNLAFKAAQQAQIDAHLAFDDFNGGTTGEQELIEDDLLSQSDSVAGDAVFTENRSQTSLSGQNLGGMTLSPGVYTFSSTAVLTGKLTLTSGDAEEPLFVFLIGTTLTVSANAEVFLDELIAAGSTEAFQARPAKVFWVVGSSAIIGSGSVFRGTVLALGAITVGDRARIKGRLLSLTGAVTLDTNDLDRSQSS